MTTERWSEQHSSPTIHLQTGHRIMGTHNSPTPRGPERHPVGSSPTEKQMRLTSQKTVNAGHDRKVPEHPVNPSLSCRRSSRWRAHGPQCSQISVRLSNHVPCKQVWSMKVPHHNLQHQKEQMTMSRATHYKPTPRGARATSMELQ